MTDEERRAHLQQHIRMAEHHSSSGAIDLSFEHFDSAEQQFRMAMNHAKAARLVKAELAQASEHTDG